jgi:hypothetical protein
MDEEPPTACAISISDVDGAEECVEEFAGRSRMSWWLRPSKFNVVRRCRSSRSHFGLSSVLNFIPLLLRWCQHVNDIVLLLWFVVMLCDITSTQSHLLTTENYLPRKANHSPLFGAESCNLFVVSSPKLRRIFALKLRLNMVANNSKHNNVGKQLSWATFKSSNCIHWQFN